MARDTRKKRVRLTKRQQKINKEVKEEIEERREVAKQRPTLQEKAESEYFKLERRAKNSFEKIQHYGSAIRGDYLDKEQKQKVLDGLHNECKKYREIIRKIFSLHHHYLGKLND